MFKINNKILDILLSNLNNNIYPDRLYFQVLLIEKNNQILKYFNNKYKIDLIIESRLIKKVKRYLKRVLRISI